MSSTTTQDSNSTSSNSTTPTNPTWVTNGASSLGGSILGIGSTDPQSYVAPSSGLEQYAYNAAPAILGNNSYLSSANSALGQASSLATPTVQASTIAPTSTYSAASAAPLIAQYENPYQSQVIQSTTDQINHDAAVADQQQQAAATSAGAWNGTGEAVLRGITGDNYTRDLATTVGNLNQQGYNTALSAAQNDAQQQNAAASQNAAAQNTTSLNQAQLQQAASLANAGYSEQQIQNYMNSAGILGSLGTQSSNNLMNLNTLGQGQQSTAQAQAQSPLSLLGTESSLFSGLPLNLFTGSNSNGTQTGTTTQTTSNPVGQLGTLAMGAGMMGFNPLAGLSMLGGVGGSTTGIPSSLLGMV